MTTQTTSDITASETFVLFGKAHRATRSRCGWTLSCSSRTVSVGRVLMLTADDVERHDNVRCIHCFGTN